MESDAILAILLSWASHLSGYPMPADLPELRFEQHEFFVENVCGSKECEVVGWYNDADIVYIDQKYNNIEEGFASGLVVHELTHYLQHKSENYNSRSCEDSVQREREAYAVQNRYSIEVLGNVNFRLPGQATCNYANALMDSRNPETVPYPGNLSWWYPRSPAVSRPRSPDTPAMPLTL